VTVVPGAAERVVELGEVVLAPLGILAGRVTTEDGSPLRGLEVTATIADPQPPAPAGFRAIQRDAGGIVLLERDDGAPPEPFAGLLAAQASTGGDGRFRICGLRPGEYELACEPDRALEARVAARALRQRGGDERFSTGATGLEIVAGGSWIEVTVESSAGLPLPGAELDLAFLRRESEEPADEAWQPVSVASEIGTLAIPLNAGDVVALRASSDLVTSGEHVARAPPEGEVARSRLTLAEIAAPARMRVRATTSDGVAAAYEVELRSPETGLTMASYRWAETDDESWSPPLPGGVYDVVVRGTEHSPLQEWYLPEPLGRIALAGGAELELACELRRGARLELVLRPQGGAEAALGRTIPGSARWLGAARPGEVSVRPAGGGRREPGQLAPRPARVLEPLLEPGRGTLVVEAPGFEIARVPVDLLAGETGRVEVELVRAAEVR
jgi:hypothetical protein